MPKPPCRSIGCLSLRLLPVIMILFIVGAAFLTEKLVSGKFMGQRAAQGSLAKDAVASRDRLATTTGTVRSGDTISSLLGGVLSSAEIHKLASEARPVFPLTKICAGSPYRLTAMDGAFQRFSCDIDANDQLVVVRKGDGFAVSREPIPYAVETVSVRGTIESSLFEAVVKIGESEGLAMQLAEIFAWDIDFFQDIQPGDSFEVVLEKRYREGKPAGNGRLLAARFTNQDQVSQAYYFKDGNRAADYYDENGHSLRKAFLKAPLSFSRISSGFTMRRRHPITHRVKAHPAIDYAAPKGTPIHTIGDGTVIFSAYKRYNGKCVKVRHANGWVTMYNHMSRFAKGLRSGKRVAQGQVIGYVGSTGLSTGPHLDFRMYKNGSPVNPLRVKSPPARPVSRTNLAAFRMMVADRVALMGSFPKENTACVVQPGMKRGFN
ncbi:MAG: peptidoglycan DD-metalloendopeptidase family protein [Geobacteraceae bacterium]|nr:peptidoglycan DD-metalloendopeptidase family protein [Geobacteraceae bacterium]